jgi:mucin-19
VTLVGEEATILNETDDFITAVAAASGAGSGDVVVTADTGAVATLEGGFVYYTKGEVNDVSPSSGQYGSIVTTSGVALRARGTKVVEVTLGGVLASIISEDNDQVVVQAASGPNFRELGAVVLTSDTGAKVVTGDEEWTYLRPSKIESISPPSGRANSRITIFGFDLCGGGDEIVNATLAGVPATLTDVSKCGTIVITAAD